MRTSSTVSAAPMGLYDCAARSGLVSGADFCLAPRGRPLPRPRPRYGPISRPPDLPPRPPPPRWYEPRPRLLPFADAGPLLEPLPPSEPADRPLLWPRPRAPPTERPRPRPSPRSAIRGGARGPAPHGADVLGSTGEGEEKGYEEAAASMRVGAVPAA